MTTTTIRRLQGQEMLDVCFDLNMYAFHASPPIPDRAEWEGVVSKRQGVTYHALFEDNLAAAGAASTAMTQNVRGALYPAGGVWGVATRPGARRSGYCRRVMASLLAAESSSGKVFSNLYPFRESFYQRLGYVTFPLPVTARFTPSALAPLLKRDWGGQVELKLIGEAFDTYRAWLAQMRLWVHGMAFFDVGDKHVADRNRLWVALAKFNDEIEGLMLYNLQGEDVGKFLFSAQRFYYKTSRARTLLLDWIARHIDQADRAEICLAPDEHPETWLEDLQVKVESQVRAPMGRVLNVARIGGMETGEGSFVARISDPLCPFNEGVWQFCTQDGRLQVAQTSGEVSPDCSLTIQGLTALVFGTHDPQDFPLRGWGDPDPKLQATLRWMFPPRLPYLHENF